MKYSPLIRIRILLGLLCCFALVISVKLYFVQIVNGKTFAKRADSQYVQPKGTLLDRGSIYFETKDGSKVGVAVMKEGYTLAINPKLLQENEENTHNVYEALSQYLTLDRDSFMEKALKPGDQYEEIQKKIDRELGLTLQSLKIPGVSVYKENWRIYPGGTLAPQTIGLIGYNEVNKVTGRYGLERFYEATLNRSTNISSVNFFAEIFANVKKTVFLEGDLQGDIVSTIDPSVQNYVEKVLLKTKESWRSDSIGAIIMDPNTGEIYSMALLPTFDPNNLKEVKDPRIFSNFLVESVYEMGSIIKPLTMAAGIDSKIITERTRYEDKGFLELNGKKISNYDGVARGVVSMQDVLSQSLNTGSATIAMKVGKEEFSRYFLSYGLGEKTGIDQPIEQKGIVDNLKSNRDIELATASYGQGIAMSPIATIRALGILANGGKLVRPHLVKVIEHADGRIEKIQEKEFPQVIKKETSEIVTKMLVEVVDKAIAKKHPGIIIPHYSIAAKTGTAQIADHTNGGYYSDRYLHSFFGYFPAYNPKFIVFLYHIYPKGADYASETLTDPFIDITKFLINYYEIPPDR